MPGGYPWLGPPGSLMQLPSPAPGYEPVDQIRGGTHELLAGTVRDRLKTLRRITLSWPVVSDANYALLRTLARLPGPYRYLDPLELNLLTANQSLGTDDLRTTEGAIARFGGTLSSSTAQFRSWSRSFAWTVTPSSTGWGIYLYSNTTVPDGTWTAVRPSTTYTASAYLRSTVAISMKAGFDWHDAAGVFISADTGGSGVALSQANFNTRVTRTATSPANAAYGIPWWTNTTTSAANVVYLDEAQMEEGSSASSFRLGVGTPLVSVDSLGHTIAVADAGLGFAWHQVELALLELS
jgi:hypothetical protein